MEGGEDIRDLPVLTEQRVFNPPKLDRNSERKNRLLAGALFSVREHFFVRYLLWLTTDTVNIVKKYFKRLSLNEPLKCTKTVRSENVVDFNESLS